MIAAFLSFFLLANPVCTHSQTLSPQWIEIEKTIEKRLDESSNLVPIASEADGILAQLISAKSPVLLSWLDKRELMAASEEKIAQEWRKYYLNNFIFTRFPSKKTQVNSSVENLFSEINKLAFPDQEKKRIEKIFDQAKTDAKIALAGWALPPKEKTQAIHRIDTIKLYWFEKLEGTRYASKTLEFINWGFAYDPIPNEINVGVQARQYPTDANLYAVLLHEMGHSLDPCRWSSFVKTKNPFEKVVRCLRDKKSVGALPRDDSRMQESVKQKLLTLEMADSLKAHPTCNRSFYPPEGTQKDQISESFADWFSAEIFATSSFSKHNPRPDLCGHQDLMKGSSYPTHQDRLLKIYLAHPSLLGLHSKKATALYCRLSEI